MAGRCALRHLQRRTDREKRERAVEAAATTVGSSQEKLTPTAISSLPREIGGSAPPTEPAETGSQSWDVGIELRTAPLREAQSARGFTMLRRVTVRPARVGSAVTRNRGPKPGAEESSQPLCETGASISSPPARSTRRTRMSPAADGSTVASYVRPSTRVCTRSSLGCSMRCTALAPTAAACARSHATTRSPGGVTRSVSAIRRGSGTAAGVIRGTSTLPPTSIRPSGRAGGACSAGGCSPLGPRSAKRSVYGSVGRGSMLMVVSEAASGATATVEGCGYHCSMASARRLAFANTKSGCRPDNFRISRRMSRVGGSANATTRRPSS